jgi:hypothetical protein
MTIYLISVVDSDVDLMLIDQFHKTFAISVFALRTLVIFILAVLSVCWPKNFDINYSDNISDATSLTIGLIGKGSKNSLLPRYARWHYQSIR